MFATAITLALFSLVMAVVIDVIHSNGRKIIAALEGRSWAAEPTAGRAVALQFNQRKEAEAGLARPVLRAAA